MSASTRQLLHWTAGTKRKHTVPAAAVHEPNLCFSAAYRSVATPAPENATSQSAELLCTPNKSIQAPSMQ